MSTSNNSLWQTVTFLFLSKLALTAKQPFAQKKLINGKNVELAQRFATMVGATTESGKVKLAMLKAVKQLEKQGYLERIDDNNLQLSDIGAEKMANEVQSAMRKIAENFPDATAANKPAPMMQ
ncbi:MAG: hypothetical protein RBR22_02380 [Desulfuromonas sp.]|nr:hypothetical protein [Desulfuromonas sp.]